MSKVYDGKQAWKALPLTAIPATGPNPDGSHGLYVPYFESCKVYGHDPVCATYLLHLQRCYEEHHARTRESR